MPALQSEEARTLTLTYSSGTGVWIRTSLPKTVLMQHLKGGRWTFLTIVRYNSWQDCATNDMNNVTQSNKNQRGWFEFSSL